MFFRVLSLLFISYYWLYFWRLLLHVTSTSPWFFSLHPPWALLCSNLVVSFCQIIFLCVVAVAQRVLWSFLLNWCMHCLSLSLSMFLWETAVLPWRSWFLVLNTDPADLFVSTTQCSTKYDQLRTLFNLCKRWVEIGLSFVFLKINNV